MAEPSKGAVLEHSETAMLDALKLKITDQDAALVRANKKLEELETNLVIEKREHQLTTLKLSQLLQKRGTNSSGDDSKEMASFKQLNFSLEQQLRHAQERENDLMKQLSTLMQQYQQLQMLKLEEFNISRSRSGIEITDDASFNSTTSTTASFHSALRSLMMNAHAHYYPPVGFSLSHLGLAMGCCASIPSDTSHDVTPTGSFISPTSSFISPTSSFISHTGSFISPTNSFCAPMWPQQLATHAEPRVSAPIADNAPSMHGSAARRGLVLPSALEGSVGTGSQNTSQTPFGYAEGAIGVQAPKRQRLGSGSSAASPSKPRAQHPG
ncbi:hypothetical protein AB1Y20_009947 [Prymnesium parvum]|uniref:Uncharacterized protein n=1 Tax=Prymnesium parvum TaxID=97485 RepID=A0AB34K817_PRYPA